MRIKTAVVTVADSAYTTLTYSGYFFRSFTVYSAAGAFLVGVLNKNGTWSDDITCYQSIPFSLDIACHGIRLKSSSGSIAINYTLVDTREGTGL